MIYRWLNFHEVVAVLDRLALTDVQRDRIADDIEALSIAPFPESAIHLPGVHGRADRLIVTVGGLVAITYSVLDPPPPPLDGPHIVVRSAFEAF